MGILEMSFAWRGDRLVMENEKIQLIRSREVISLGQIKIHSAVSTDLTKNLVLFDSEQMHVIDMNNYNTNTFYVQRVVSHPNLQIQGVHLFQNRFLYCLFNSRLKADASASQIDSFSNGFGMIDLASLNNDISTTPLLLPISDAIVGINGEFVFCKADQRIAFLQDYDKMVRVPLLHENKLVLQGIRPKSEYLAYRAIDETLIALDTRGRLYSWQLRTGLRNMQ